MANQRLQAELLAEYYRYVMNDIPLRMIYVPEMKLVTRQFVASHLRATIEALTDQELREAKVLEALGTKAVGHMRYVREKVKYAILSHRWLEQETSYQQAISGGIRGDDKLERFCAVAGSYGIEFAWADTCCIDKSSSAELDESIRSMFRWYENSEICIVHLAQTTVLDELVADEWWIRGWTLQEFLAPERIKFLNKDWKALTEADNDRAVNALLPLIEEASGIGHKHARVFSPVPTNVGEKMAWAARRKTTRDEDVAYSLMGIFDVSLQIAYGEGKERAFVRLMEAIMRSGDPSVLHWAGPAASHRSSEAIPSSPACYVGQPSEGLTLGTAGVLLEKLDIAVTSRGLRIPMVVLPLRLTRRHSDASHAWVLECPIIPGAIVNANLTELPDLYIEAPRAEYALGIFTYTRLVRTSNPGLFGSSMPYLLRRELLDETKPEEGAGVENCNLGLRSADRSNVYCPREWVRILDREYITLHIPGAHQPGTLNGSMFFVDKKYLEIVYL
ncbi:hypothetical protein BV22DRAFT_625835 [Leucogyrophana mollusca]|uniref:Uncharacterized protein n=1 Tax=Leucogyrophana mollusca TaxID=85980 RepID=A0ACB8BCL7_9AGAM|nr:hypothetical protein BV22DRAFT_625835 [Leucogyrophana mollusca]